MKRMSEFFKLPVTTVYGGKWANVRPRDAEIHAAHAINHVDALADALGSLIDAIRHDHLVSLKSKTEDAMAVLNAYRDAK